MYSRFAFVAILTLSGCGMPHLSRAKAPPPPGPVPARIPDQVATTTAPAPTNLPAPPSLSEPAADAKAPVAAELSLATTPTEPPPRPARGRRAAKQRTAAAATPPPVPVEAAAGTAQSPSTTPAPPFRLGELRSPEEKERLKLEAEQMLITCNTVLAAVGGKPLTASQTEMVSRVRLFAQQARESMEKDPAEARNLAAKGRTFAEALLAELK